VHAWGVLAWVINPPMWSDPTNPSLSTPLSVEMKSSPNDKSERPHRKQLPEVNSSSVPCRRAVGLTETLLRALQRHSLAGRKGALCKLKTPERTGKP
jgi:hypothetical protein